VGTPLEEGSTAELDPDRGNHRSWIGTPSTTPKRADLSQVIAAAESIVGCLHSGNLVVLESTVPPRTTKDVLVPLVHRSRAADLFVAHCPERVLPGRILEELVCNDRIIGGVDRASAEAAGALYASFVQGDIVLTDATTAELTKLMENTYRDVNIALANEFALVAEHIGVDVWQAIALANHHPRVDILKPGPGVGGHCIAVDPWFVAEAAPELTPLIQTARRVNDAVPARVVQTVRDAVAGPSSPTIACLGLAYKADVDDTRESPSLEVIRLLQAAGFTVRAYDPYVPQMPGLDEIVVESLARALDGADGVVVLTDHKEFRGLSAEGLGRAAGRFVLDTRDCLQRDEGAHRS
jgi:UDP-N-acetyl-D-mannosaminuronic acid dehydrogenase